MKVVLEMPELDSYVKEAVTAAVRHMMNSDSVAETARIAIREIVSENRETIISEATDKCVKSIMIRLLREKAYKQAKEEFLA